MASDPHDAQEDRRLFASIPPSDPLHRMVRDGLEGLSVGSDPELRRLASAILGGEADVKDLLTAPAFAPFLAAAARQSREERSGLSPEQLAQLRESVRRGAREGTATDD